MNYFFGDDLKETPEDKAEFRKGIEFWKAKLISEDKVYEKSKLLSTIGVHLRIAGQLNESLTYLNKAEAILGTLPLSRTFVVNGIRIAQTLQALKRFNKSTLYFRDIEKLIEVNTQFSNLLHFVYQHQGKNYFDQQKYRLAKTYIERALAIRQQMNDADLIASSAFALNIITQHLKSK